MPRKQKFNKAQLKTIELLKTGNFSLHFHDSAYGSIYEGHHQYDQLLDEDGIEDNPNIKEVYKFNEYVNREGYLLDVVNLLVTALGGVSGSI